MMLAPDSPLSLTSTSFMQSVATTGETAKLDTASPSRFDWWQGVVTLHNDTQARKPWFFCALSKVIIFGRGGESSIKNPFRGRLSRRSMAVTNTPIVLVSNRLSKIIGGHTHA